MIDAVATPVGRQRLMAICLGIGLGVGLGVASVPTPAQARGPEAIADVTEKVIDAVVNISTSQSVQVRGGGDRQTMPQLPPGSPFEEFFEDFFKNRRGPGGDKGANPRKDRSIGAGSGFIISADGYVVTNNHVIADADEVNVILNDGSKARAEIVGVDKKTDLALLKIKPEKPLTAVKFGDSDALRLGEWVVAIGNPFSLGGTVTAGIVSARNRDINSGPYDSYIQTDAAINRGNSGGPLFNLNGDVVGVNTAIISPSGGSIGIGFAVPSKTVAAVIDQLREFKEVRRGWLGVRIQQVTDEIAESLGIKPVRGVLVAGVNDNGPAKPAGIEAGDVIVRFNGKDVKEPKDLSRIVAETPSGKTVDVAIIRKGVEQTKQVTVARLDDSAEVVKASAKSNGDNVEKTPTQKVLGLDLANISKELRTRFKIKDSVKGVVVTGVDDSSDAAEKRIGVGDIIVEVTQEAVTSADDVKKRIDQLKKDGKKSALLVVSNAEGDRRFVAVSLK